MKIFINLLILLLVLACGAPFFIKGPDGRSLMNVNSLKFPELSLFSMESLKNKFEPLKETKNNSQATHNDAIQVYKWRDEKGVIHYSDRQASGQKSELTEIKGITILPSGSTQPSFKPKPRNTTSTKNNNSHLPGLTTIPLREIPQLVKDAKQVEQELIERKQRQDTIIEGGR